MSSKRQRELARRRAERQAVRRAEAAAARRRRQKVTWSVFAGVLSLVLLVFIGTQVIGDDKDDPTPAASQTSDASATASPSAGGTPTASPKPGECAYNKAQEQGKDVGLPPATGFDKKPRTATIKLNRGSVVAEMFSDKAPCTVSSLGHLAAKKYFDGTKCHRLTTEGLFVLQCGDPTGTGSGGPGYQFAEENLEGATYPAGTLAMASAAVRRISRRP